MGTRRKGREFALQALYLADLTKLTQDKAFRCLTYGGSVDDKVRDFARDLAAGTTREAERLDEVIRKYAQNWDIARMAALDRNILRLGAYEILFELDTPVSVIIDEAVEIAKEYSTADSGKFVNGILDRIKDERKKKKD
jgi:transcription antitermination protein NusB